MKRIFLDTDYGNVYDDAGALAVLHALADRGEAELVGMTTCVWHVHSVGALCSTNKFFGREEIPLGAYRRNLIDSGEEMYARELVEQFPARIKKRDDAPEAVDLTRQVLSCQPDGSVTYIAIGACNNLADLLRSEGDSWSPLDGKALVAQKIDCLVIMGGSLDNGKVKRTDNPHDVPPGWTYNWSYYAPEDACYVMANWPTKVEILTSEAGYVIRTGVGVYRPELPRNPVTAAYHAYRSKAADGKTTDGAWDQLTMLLAVRGYDHRWEVAENGRCIVDEDGCSHWEQEAGSHSYGIVREAYVAELSALCDSLMVEGIQNWKKRLLVNPTLACGDWLNLRKDLDALKKTGCGILHIDVMDGHYVPNLCFNLEQLRAIKREYPFLLDVHLMVSDPGNYLEPLAKAGADFVSFHLDAVSFPVRLARQAKALGMRVGMVLNPKERPEVVEHLLTEMDFVLVMGVEPGFSGQRFLPSVYEKLEKLSALRQALHPSLLLEVDGGIDAQNGPECRKRGADMLVSGVFGVFSRKNGVQEDYLDFQKALVV